MGSNIIPILQWSKLRSRERLSNMPKAIHLLRDRARICTGESESTLGCCYSTCKKMKKGPLNVFWMNWVIETYFVCIVDALLYFMLIFLLLNNISDRILNNLSYKIFSLTIDWFQFNISKLCISYIHITILYILHVSFST